jgi:hypothetical protein
MSQTRLIHPDTMARLRMLEELVARSSRDVGPEIVCDASGDTAAMAIDQVYDAARAVSHSELDRADT